MVAQVITGIRAILSHPKVYDTFQNLMGGRKRGGFVEDFIRPFSGMRLLDVGCGTAQILDFLPDDVEYIGYDPSPEYIAHARRRYGARGAFHLGIFGEEDAKDADAFDMVALQGVLHHLGDDEVLHLMSLFQKVLVPGGRLVSIDPTFSSDQNPISRLLVSMDRGQNVRSGQGYTDLAETIFENVTGTIRHRAWIPYTHWIMECVA